MTQKDNLGQTLESWNYGIVFVTLHLFKNRPFQHSHQNLIIIKDQPGLSRREMGKQTEERQRELRSLTFPLLLDYPGGRADLGDVSI